MNDFLKGYSILFSLLCLGAVASQMRAHGSVPKGGAAAGDSRQALKNAEGTSEDARENAGSIDRATEAGKAYTWVCFALLLFALFIRIWKFGLIPGGMNQDGAMAAVDAKALADYGTDRFGMFLPVHFTAWGYGQMSVLMSYCMVPFIKLFGLSAVTARLPILIASLAGLFALYGIGRMLFGEKGALLLLFFAACNPWHFIQSRWALDCNMFPHMFIIGFFFLLLGIREKKRYVYLSMLFFALCMYAYGIAFYTVPVFLLILAIYLLTQRLLRWRDVFLCILIYLGLSWPIILTMAINAFGGETIRTPFCTIPYFPDSIRSRDILFFSDQKAEQFRNNVLSLLAVYVRGDYLPWNTVPGYGAVPICFLPFALIGVIKSCILLRREKRPEKKAAYFAALAYFFIGNLSGIITAWVNVNRINILFYGLMLMVGIGMEYTCRRLKKFFWAVPAACLILSAFFLKDYFTEHSQTLSYYYFQDFLEAVCFAQKEIPRSRFCITPVVRGQEAAANTAEILTLFALQVDAEFYQGKVLDENGLSYHEKYQYRTISEGEIPRSDTVYLITKEDAAREIWRECVLIPVKGYYVAVME